MGLKSYDAGSQAAVELLAPSPISAVLDRDQYASASYTGDTASLRQRHGVPMGGLNRTKAALNRVQGSLPRADRGMSAASLAGCMACAEME